jgi:hypothetical protein
MSNGGATTPNPGMDKDARLLESVGGGCSKG